MKTNYSDLFQLKKNQSSAKLSLVEGGPGPGHHPHQQHHQHHQPTAAKYMKRLLSPSSTDRQPLPVPGGKEVKLEIAVFIPRVVLVVGGQFGANLWGNEEPITDTTHSAIGRVKLQTITLTAYFIFVTYNKF